MPVVRCAFPAEQQVVKAIDPHRFEVEIVHLGQSKARLAEAEASGVKSVPALVIGGAAISYQLRRRAGGPEVIAASRSEGSSTRRLLPC